MGTEQGKEKDEEKERDMVRWAEKDKRQRDRESNGQK